MSQSQNTLPANKDLWPPASKRSDRCVPYDPFYTDRPYICRRCGQPAVYSAADQKQAVEVWKAQIWQPRVLCPDCWRERQQLEKKIAACNSRWSRSKATLKQNRPFLSEWLMWLELHPSYGGRKNTATIAMLRRLGASLTASAAPIPETRPCTAPGFPEPVRYISPECQTGLPIQDWDTADKLLRDLDPEHSYFADFMLPDYSYAGCFGAKTRLKVEAREFHRDGSFTQWIFGRGEPVGKPECIKATIMSVTVDASQLLTIQDARLIIRQFLETRTFPSTYHREDVTGQFAKMIAKMKKTKPQRNPATCSAPSA